MKRIEKVIALILRPIRENSIFFIFLYLLGILTMIIEVWALNYKIQRFNFFSWIFDLYLICLLLTLLPYKIRIWWKVITAFILYSLSLINSFCAHRFSAKIGTEILNVVLETNPRESSEFIEKYINFDILQTGVGVILILLIIHLILTFSLKRFKQKLIYKWENFHFPISKTILKYSMVLFIIASFLICAQSRIRVIQLLMVEDVEDVDNYTSNFAENTPFNNLLFSLKMRQLANRGLKVLADTQEKVKIDTCTYTSNHIVLIIGESYIKDHAQLYGYSKETTPCQMERQQNSKHGCLVAFTDVISPSNLTSIVFKNSFSMHSIEDKSNWSYFPLFPVLFRRAGYNVTFLTNQFVQALNNDIFNASGGLFLNEKRLSTAQFDHRNTRTHQFDIGLLSDYDSLKQFNSAHQLTIFHLAGQHIDFYKRSPEKMKKFSISDYQERNNLDNSAKQLVADYDNATLYNDYVVDSILKKYESEDAIVIYMPDHGEECYDELQRMGRLPVGNYSPEVLRQEYRIPFWIWCSDKYINKHLEIFEQVKDAKNRPFMIDDLPHLMLYLAGIHCKTYQETRCLISDKFNMKRKRLVAGIIDYDSIVTNTKNNRNNKSH